MWLVDVGGCRRGYDVFAVDTGEIRRSMRLILGGLFLCVWSRWEEEEARGRKRVARLSRRRNCFEVREHRPRSV